MQIHHLQKLAHAATIGVTLLKAGEQALIFGGPLVAPLAQGRGVGKRARPLPEERQIMQRVADVLLPGVAAGMGGQDLLLIEEGDGKGTGLEGQLGPGLIHRHGRAVGLKLHLTGAVEAHGSGDGIVQRARGQRAQHRLFLLPGRANAVGCPLDDADIIPFTPGQEMGIEVGKGGHLGDGDQLVAAHKADAMLDAAVLLGGVWRAEVGGKAVMAAEDGEGGLLLAGGTAQEGLYGGGAVVVADAVGNAAKEAEGGLMAGEEAFLALGGNGHHEGAAGRAESDNQHRHRHAGSGQVNLGFAPIDLGVLTGIKLEGQKGGRALLLLPQFADRDADWSGTAGKALVLNKLKDALGRIPLLAWHVGILLHKVGDTLAVRTKFGCRPRGAHRGGGGVCRSQGFFHRVPRKAQLAGNRPHAFVLGVVGITNSGTVVHRDHLLILRLS